MAKELTEMQTKFLDALFDPEVKGDLHLAAKMAGYSNPRMYMKIVAGLKEEIFERSQLVLAANAAKASMEMVGIIDKPTTLGAKEIMAATREVLDRVGIVKVDKVEVKSDSSAGVVFIMPPKDKPSIPETD